MRVLRYARWGLLLLVLVTLGSEIPAWWSLFSYRQLRDYDFVARSSALLHDHRLSAARTVAEAGVASARPQQVQGSRRVLREIRQRTGSIGYRADQVVRGIFLGAGDNGWALGGAVVSDLFVFGDVRDLTIQGARAVRGQPVDKLMVGLSTLGLATTLLPVTDLGLDLLKSARRGGVLTGKFIRALSLSGRGTDIAGGTKTLAAVATGAGRLERRAGPAVTRAVLGEVQSPAELARAARFVKRNPQGGFALWLAGRRGMQALNHRLADDLLLAVRKGPAGVAWLGRGSARMLHFHPLLGLLKGVYKGNVSGWAVVLAGRHLPLLVTLALAWAMLEAAAPARRLWRRR